MPCILSGIGSIAFAITYIVRTYVHDEQTRRTAADQDYARGAFRAAAKSYHELAEKHSRSEHVAVYRVLADLPDEEFERPWAWRMYDDGVRHGRRRPGPGRHA